MKLNEKQQKKSKDDEVKQNFDEMINQLKEKFQSSGNRSEKLEVLTVLPKSWSIRKIEKEFQASNYMARKSKKLVQEKGLLSTPNPKPGNNLSKKTTDDVVLFYKSDAISREMPGKRDCVSMIVKGRKERVQKRLILCNLKEAYQTLKNDNSVKIGFSKFASLRPKNVVLLGGMCLHNPPKFQIDD